MAKRQLPQTKEGLARVISVILNLYGGGGCRYSECKEGINNLTRAYGRQFCHRKPSRVSVTAARAPEGTECPEDHVVPVKVLMAHLMACAKQGPIEPEQVMSFLDENSLTCKITAEEDKKLRDARLWNAMPEGSLCRQTGLILNQWARYEHQLVAIELEVQPQ
jgi:hypothetical protein